MLSANMRAIHEAIGTSPPHSSDDESAVVNRVTNKLKRVRDEEKASVEEELRARLGTAPAGSIDRENMEKTLLCNVCLANPSDVLIKKCGHVSVCSSCVERDHDVRWGVSGSFRCYHCNTEAHVTDLLRVQVV